MQKTLQIILLLILFFFLSPYLWAQEYTFKTNIGQVLIYKARDITIDTKGNVYVVNDDRAVVKLDSMGNFISFIGNYAMPSARHENYITADKNGNLWVSEGYGGRIAKYDPKGNLLLRFFVDEVGGSASSQGISIDSQENIWVIDQNDYCVRKFDKNGLLLLRFGSYGISKGEFKTPLALVADNEDNIWVADGGNYRIQKFNSTGAFLGAFGMEGSGKGQFNYPRDIVCDKQGNILISDYRNNRIQKIDKKGNFIQVFGTFGYSYGKLANPNMLTIDNQGVIWIQDAQFSSAKSRIQRFDSNGNFLSGFPYSKEENTPLNFPKRLTSDSQGNTWIVDTGNSTLLKFDKDGSLLLKVGSYGSDNDQFQNPEGITIDREDNIWVIDSPNSLIKKFDKNGNFLFSFGSIGQNNGQLSYPHSISLDQHNNIWVADENAIQKFDKNGNFLLRRISYGNNNQKFYRPTDITTDRKDNVLVLERGSTDILKFDRDGNFLLKISSYGSANTTFASNKDITVDSEDNIWVAEKDYQHIIKLNADGKFLMKFIPSIKPEYIHIDKTGDVYLSNSLLGVMVYTKDHDAFIHGIVYADENQNCKFDGSDKPISDIILKTEPGNYYGKTDSGGNYWIKVPIGSYTVNQALKTNNILLQPVCQTNNASTTVTLIKEREQIFDINFANTAIKIPYLDITVSSNRRRRCSTNTTLIRYSNTGYADAHNVKVFVKMPLYISLKSANAPYTIDTDSNYVFTIGTLSANQTGVITIIDSVACVAKARGLTACTKTWIIPANSYTLSENSNWDNSDISLRGKCIENGRVQLVIKNMGQSMTDSAQFRILLNTQLSFYRNYRLAQGDSLVLKIPANGKTIRLEADQRPGHPQKYQTNLTIEGCIASVSDIISTGFVNALPQDDSEAEVNTDCQIIVDSYDPNDKQVSPSGITSEHYTPTTSELKYVVRFQNTGTDYAYNVVIVDTLSENLDISTLRMGSVSHAYTLKVSGKGHPVLTWTFNDINLPDSTRDQAGSNGFIQFLIKPKTGLSEKARIENFADIFFDYNDPVRTNTTTNVLYDIPPIIAEENKLNEKGLLFLIPTISNFTPEQAQVGEQLTVTGTNYQAVITDNTVKINGITATVVSANEMQLIVTVPQGVTAGKVSVTTPGGTATSETDFVMKPTASEQPQWSRPIVISPNPTEGRFTIDFSKTGVQIQAIEIYNHLGQQISSQTVSKVTARKEVDLSDTGTGIYLVVFKTDKGNATRKLIVK
ncbi:T9SS type A sorting domain-containing protein [Cytophagaceae bacterium DM2B3-1]|uniref:T9SS type A sorting domain-containing protein n=1 Tax=Xanthocytophaga flava TaxID=3048013 RepID=A0ABT7CU79_9BACT|nr:T9SS type A sorting domain-containing protein [Xanthocytophaga flavus]MDJ1469162.1 T9SS type A sorting domain-containing protein [Xanthocytophaga flavus]MDJ1497292.1 T9SS type A sorting domain-containing protein [Xanthocytophaga flavus]